MKVHVCQSVSGAIKNWKKKEWESVAKSSGCTPDALKERFMIMEFEGIKVIPLGDPCEGFSYQTGCPGHEEIKCPISS